MFTVTFDTDGGTPPIVERKVPKGEKVTAPTPTKEGYSFVEWKKEGETTVFNFDTPITENITLKAFWTLNWEIKTLTNNEVVLTKYIGKDTEIIIIPSYIEGKKVIEIGNTPEKSIFYGKGPLIKKVTIPEGINIGSWAFSDCINLTSINIPNSVTSIKKYTFRNCASLKSITIPYKVTSIEFGAFSFCSSLESITISNNVTSIEGSTFSFCSSLKSITIPDNVTYVGSAFFGSGLTNISAPSSLKGQETKWKVPDDATITWRD